MSAANDKRKADEDASGAAPIDSHKRLKSEEIPASAVTAAAAPVAAAAADGTNTGASTATASASATGGGGSDPNQQYYQQYMQQQQQILPPMQQHTSAAPAGYYDPSAAAAAAAQYTQHYSYSQPPQPQYSQQPFAYGAPPPPQQHQQMQQPYQPLQQPQQQQQQPQQPQVPHHYQPLPQQQPQLPQQQSQPSQSQQSQQQQSSLAAAAASKEAEIPLPESHSTDPPSKVIHFRNVTQDIEQGDIMSVCQPFGPVEKVLLMRTKNQCLLMFQHLAHSIAFMNYYTDTNTTPMVRQRKIFCRFSRHQQLTASSNVTVSKIILATLAMSFQPSDYGITITADIVWQIFSPYGTVEKIVLMQKDATLQALVQYASQEACATAFTALHNKLVYVATEPPVDITLYLQYSHLADLTVRAQSIKARDYTQTGGMMTPSAYAPPPQQQQQQQPPPQQQQQQPQQYGAPLQYQQQQMPSPYYAQPPPQQQQQMQPQQQQMQPPPQSQYQQSAMPLSDPNAVAAAAYGMDPNQYAAMAAAYNQYYQQQPQQPPQQQQMQQLQQQQTGASPYPTPAQNATPASATATATAAAGTDPTPAAGAQTDVPAQTTAPPAQ